MRSRTNRMETYNLLSICSLTIQLRTKRANAMNNWSTESETCWNKFKICSKLIVIIGCGRWTGTSFSRNLINPLHPNPNRIWSIYLRCDRKTTFRVRLLRLPRFCSKSESIEFRDSLALLLNPQPHTQIGCPNYHKICFQAIKWQIFSAEQMIFALNQLCLLHGDEEDWRSRRRWVAEYSCNLQIGPISRQTK